MHSNAKYYIIANIKMGFKTNFIVIYYKANSFAHINAFSRLCFQNKPKENTTENTEYMFYTV